MGLLKNILRGKNSLCEDQFTLEKVNYYTLVSTCRYILTEIHEQKGKKPHETHMFIIFIMNQQSLDLFSGFQMHKLVCLDSTVFASIFSSPGQTPCELLPSLGVRRKL